MTAYNIPAFATEGANPFLQEESPMPTPARVMLAEGAASEPGSATQAARDASSTTGAAGNAGCSGATGKAPIDPAREKAISAKLASIGVAGNVALSAFKLIAGIFGNSSAMISDAVHSLSDVFATAIAYVGVRLSKREADETHPYGHERFECVASLALGIILAFTGLAIGLSSVESIASGAYLDAATPGMLALVAAVVSIVVKEAMFWYTRHWARVLDSSAFMADAWHHRSDALSSIGALLGIGAAMLGFPIGDPLASIVICVIVLKVALDVLKDAVDKMLDTPCDDEFEASVADVITATAGVVRIDALRTRQFGNKVYVDAEIAVRGSLPLAEAHAIAEAAHDAVEARFPKVKHIMIHENPA
mgnify:CR=1 FL=1